MTVQYIDNDHDLISLCQQLATSDWITVDTEFLREKTYHPQLCLIQVATADVIACVDPLAIKDITPLLDVLYRPGVTLVFHAARQDLELFYLLRGELPQSLFDTQLAATVLGYGDQIGYGNLVKQCLGVELDKAHSRTDWSKRPLDSGQIDYAADDVRYLRDIYHRLLSELNEKQRLGWLDDDFNTLADTKTYTPDPDSIWRKVKGAGRLKGVQLAILQKLCAWRENRATKTNRPRRWILKDEVLLDLARLAPDSTKKMTVIRGLESGTVERHGDALLECISAAKALPKAEWPVMKKPTILTAKQDVIVDAMMALLRKYCHQHTIAPAAVASRKDIERVVAGDKTVNLLHGWRYEIIGHQLTQFLTGQLTLHIDDGQLVAIEQG